MLPPGTLRIEVVLAGQKSSKGIVFEGKPVEVSL